MGLERKIWSDRWFYATLMEWDVSFCKHFLGYHRFFFLFVCFLIFFPGKMAGEPVETAWEFNEKCKIWVPLQSTS